MVLTVLNQAAPVFTTHSGREKLARLIQYLLGVIIPTLQKRQPSGRLIETAGRSTDQEARILKLIAKMAIIKSSMSMTRKVMRFGQQVPILIGIIQRLVDH